MQHPREGMMAVVRNRRAMITAVAPFDADEQGRFHLVDVEYADGMGVEADQVLWEVEPGAEVLEPAALPKVGDTAPMDPRESDAMVRAARWSALTPSLPFSGLVEERPPLAAPLYGAIYPEAYQLVPVLRALDMPRVALLLADAVGLGKTIQAGMVLRELMLRRRIRRILVICPAALRTQWRVEMQDKFALPFEVVDRPQTLKLQKELGVDANPWRTHERIIASYHYLKQPDVESLDPVRFTRKSELDEEDRRRVGEAVIRRLKSEINESYTARNEPARFSERHVKALPSLHFGAQERSLHLAVRDFRKALRRAVRGAPPNDRTAAAFATEVLQKRLLSGPWAFGQSWLALVEGMNDEGATAEAVARVSAVSVDDTDDDAEKESRHRHAGKVVGAWLRQWKDQVAAEVAPISELVGLLGVTRVPPGLDPADQRAAVADRAAKVKADARMRALEMLIDERVRSGHGWKADERLVVFTEYLATLVRCTTG